MEDVPRSWFPDRLDAKLLWSFGNSGLDGALIGTRRECSLRSLEEEWDCFAFCWVTNTGAVRSGMTTGISGRHAAGAARR
jgi:hypothetical protein